MEEKGREGGAIVTKIALKISSFQIFAHRIESSVSDNMLLLNLAIIAQDESNRVYCILLRGKDIH